MVASFLDKAVSKSYVRLPGSGSDKAAGASFCDLSRGSSLAASIPVPPHMGTPSGLADKLAPRTATPRTDNKRPRIEDATVDVNESNKRPHIDGTNQNVARAPSDLTFAPATVPVGPVTVSPQVINNNFVPTTNRANNKPVRETQNPTKFFIISNTVCDMTKLQEENAQLKSENAILQKQLSLFKQLIRNPQRLDSVLQRLNERLKE